MQVRDGEVRVPPRHAQTLVAHEFCDVAKRDATLTETARVSMTKVMPAKIFDASGSNRGWEPVCIDVQCFSGKIAYNASIAVTARFKRYQGANRRWIGGMCTGSSFLLRGIVATQSTSYKCVESDDSAVMVPYFHPSVVIVPVFMLGARYCKTYSVRGPVQN